MNYKLKALLILIVTVTFLFGACGILIAFTGIGSNYFTPENGTMIGLASVVMSGLSVWIFTQLQNEADEFE